MVFRYVSILQMCTHQFLAHLEQGDLISPSPGLKQVINTLIDSLPNIDGKRFRFLCNIITSHAMLRNRSTEQEIPQVDPQALQ